MVTDEQLILDVRGGSRDAFATLFDRHREAVWRFFRRRVRDGACAEDLVQDVFVAVFRNAARYEPRSSFRSYLFGIAYKVLLADRRKSDRRATAPLEDVPGSPPDPDAALWVRRALATLDPDARELVMLREYDQLSYQEIADLLCIPLNTVRSRLFRARMDLKAALLRQQDGRHAAPLARNLSSASGGSAGGARNFSSASETGARRGDAASNESLS